MTLTNFKHVPYLKGCPMCDNKEIHIPVNMQDGNIVFKHTTGVEYAIPVNLVKCRQCGYLMFFTEAE